MKPPANITPGWYSRHNLKGDIFFCATDLRATLTQVFPGLPNWTGHQFGWCWRFAGVASVAGYRRVPKCIHVFSNLHTSSLCVVAEIIAKKRKKVLDWFLQSAPDNTGDIYTQLRWEKTDDYITTGSHTISAHHMFDFAPIIGRCYSFPFNSNKTPCGPEADNRQLTPGSTSASVQLRLPSSRTAT